jgi:prepilin-type N-terminal cleavage/methylation domain-containing protein
MRQHHLPKHPAGFTLIELVVVLAIIAILMALLLPWVAEAPQAARRREAAIVAKNIVNALNNYRNDYGAFPKVGSPRSPGEKFILVGDRASGCPESNGALLDVLRAIPRGSNANHVLNMRQVKYFEGRKAVDPQTPRDGFADGSKFSPEIQGRLYDPWGAEYLIFFEVDGDESIEAGSLYADLTAPEDAIKSPAAAISLGKDGKLGGKGYEGRLSKPNSNEAPDDITSW